MNTLPTTVLRKDGYLHELRTAIKECTDNLNKLQKIHPTPGALKEMVSFIFMLLLFTSDIIFNKNLLLYSWLIHNSTFIYKSRIIIIIKLFNYNYLNYY